MALTLYPVQKISHDALVDSIKRIGAALDSSDTGTGKTLKAVEVAKTLGLAPVVVCPKAVIPAWDKCFREQGVKSWFSWGWEKIRTGNTPTLEKRGKAKFMWKPSPMDTLLIFDECHKAKGIKTLNSKMVMAARAQGYKILCLSATAAEDPREMKALGYVLRLHEGKNFYDWAKHWGCEFDDWNSLIFPQKNQHKLQELNKIIYPDRGHKLTREDLGEHFQECRVITDPIRFGKGNKIETLAQELSEELEILESRREGDGDHPIALTKILRLRQEIELLKVPEIVDLIDNERASGQSVAVFLNFRDSISAVSNRLKEKHTFIQGGQSASEREEAITKFQDNTVRVILCNSQAGGVGVSLHDTDGKFPRTAFISPQYDAKSFHQTLGRIDRLGGKSNSLQKILVAEGTFEEGIVKRMMEKISNIQLLHTKSDVLSTDMGEENQIPEQIHTDMHIASGTESAHARFSPSSLKLHKACPGYKSQSGTNPAAEMGTRIHDALETGDWSKLQSDYESSLAQFCSNVDDMILKKHFPKGEYLDYKEVRLVVDLLGCETFGTCDRLCVNGATAAQIDYKTGRHAVDEPASNMQAKAYSLGTFQKFPQVDTIFFYFVCCQRNEILFDTFTRDQVSDLTEELSAVIKNAERCSDNFDSVDINDLHPQMYVCNYCARAGECPALTAKLMQVARNYEGDDELEVPDVVHGSELHDDPETLAKLLDLAPILEKAISGWRLAARIAVFEDGLEIPSYEEKSRSGKRTITSALAAFGIVKDIVEVEDFLDGVGAFPVTKFEKLIAEKTPRGKKKEKVAEIMAELEDLGCVKHAEDIRYLSKIK